MKILITGANGFVGRNLQVGLKQAGYSVDDVLCYDINNSLDELVLMAEQADFVVHLAGVNRPQSVEEFKAGNTNFTARLTEILLQAKKPPILMSSTIQAKLDNPYGTSKLGAEQMLEEYATKDGTAIIFRLPNVFGKWCRPNYNSAVATFCYNISHDIPIQISGRENEVNLVYIDDVVRAFVEEVHKRDSASGSSEVNVHEVHRGEVLPVLTTTVGELADTIYSFRVNREAKVLPDMSDYLTKCLYSTYLSYLDEDNFSYALDVKRDERGWLAELIKSRHFGQIFVSTTKPGVVRGNHYHNTKVEKFFVIAGHGVIRFRKIDSDEVLVYEVGDANLAVVDIPPGYTHSIENTGNNDLITLFWANEVFDAARADTYFEKVLIGASVVHAVVVHAV